MENPIKMDDFFNGASIWMVKSWSLIYYMPVGSARLCGGSSAGAEDVQDGQMFNNNRCPLTNIWYHGIFGIPTIIYPPLST